MKLSSLCTGLNTAMVRGRLLLTEGLSVQSILDANANAMADGGTLGEASTKAQGIVAGGYHLVFGGGVILLLIGLFVFGASMALSGSQGLAEKKSQIGLKALGILIALGSVPIMLFAESIASGIFGG